jgi:DNA-binding transcriptional ArsR family regulator
MSRPLYQLKAEFFKTLGHPARIRVLELLSTREYAVAELLPELDVEPSNLSQQLAVARTILTSVLSGQIELLEDIHDPEPPAFARGPAAG